MAFGSNQTFEPRVGTAQLIFGVVYSLITLTALVLALYVRQTEGSEPWLHYFMSALFAIMALKSFIIHARIKKLLQTGVYYEAKVQSCEPVRGITIIKGECDVKDYGLIHIESRLVGEAIAHEINRYLQEHKQEYLPALVVGESSNRPRGMFTVKGLHGHLIEESARLKNADVNDENTEEKENPQDIMAKLQKAETEQNEVNATHSKLEEIKAAPSEQDEVNADAHEKKEDSKV